MTDGVQDVKVGNPDGSLDYKYTQYDNWGGWAHAIAPLDSSLCQSLKDRGVKIAVLYTPFMPTLPGVSQLSDYVISNWAPDISIKLQACASDGYFYTADSTGIGAELKKCSRTRCLVLRVLRGKEFLRSSSCHKSAQGAAADPRRTLGQKPLHHLVQRDILALSISPKMKASCASRLETRRRHCGRGASSPIFARAIQRIALDIPTPNRAAARRADMPHQRPSKPVTEDRRSVLVPSSTSSMWMLNHRQSLPSHYNRFIGRKTCSRQ